MIGGAAWRRGWRHKWDRLTHIGALAAPFGSFGSFVGVVEPPMLQCYHHLFFLDHLGGGLAAWVASQMLQGTRKNDIMTRIDPEKNANLHGSKKNEIVMTQ